MRKYEMVVIIDPEVSESGRQAVLDRFTEIIEAQNGFLIGFDDWGNRKLAYEIKKKARGHYVIINMCGGGEQVDEMERFCRIDDRLLKYMTVLLDKEADLEQIKAELAEKEAELEAKKSQAAAAAAAAEEAAEKAQKAKESDAEETSEEAPQPKSETNEEE